MEINKLKESLAVFAKVELKPEDDSKVTLFADKGEAIVFWLCLTGLAFLTILSVVKYSSAKDQNIKYQKVEATQVELTAKIDSLNNQNKVYVSQIEILNEKLGQNQLQVSRLQAKLDELNTFAILGQPNQAPSRKQIILPPESQNPKLLSIK